MMQPSGQQPRHDVPSTEWSRASIARLPEQRDDLSPKREMVPDIIRHLRNLDSESFQALLPQLIVHGVQWATPRFVREVHQAIREILPLANSNQAKIFTREMANICQSLLQAGIAYEDKNEPVLTAELIRKLQKTLPVESANLTAVAIEQGLSISGTIATESLIETIRMATRRAEFECVVALIKTMGEHSYFEPASFISDPKLASVFTSALRWSLDHRFSREGLERLDSMASAAIHLLSHGILTEHDPSHPITTTRFIVELQESSPVVAARICCLALQNSLRISEPTVLHTLVGLNKRARSIEDLVPMAELASTALNYRAIDIENPKVIESYNVLLSRLADPFPIERTEFRQYRQETDLLDVAQRQLLALKVATAVMNSDMKFNAPENEDRINLTVRGLCSVAGGLNLEYIRTTYDITPDSMQDITRSIGYNFEYKPIESHRISRENSVQLAHELVRGAIELAHGCSRWNTHAFPAKSAVVQRFQLTGNTINSLITAIEASELPLHDVDAVKLLQIIEKAVPIRQVRLKLYSHAVSLALNTVLYADSVSPIVKSLVTARIATLPHGLQLPRSLIEKTQSLLNDIGSRTQQERGSALPEIERLQRAFIPSRGKPTIPASTPRPQSQDIKGPRLPWFSQLLHETGMFAHLYKTPDDAASSQPLDTDL